MTGSPPWRTGPDEGSWTARPGRWFTVVALLALALSLTGPLAAAAAASVAAVLVTLHLVVAAIIILVLPARW